MKKWMTILVILIVIGTSTGGIIAANQLYFSEDDSGEETVKAEMGDKVTVHYTGMLQDKRIYGNEWRVFDTSRKSVPEEKILTYREGERGQPYTFTLGEGVIEGWNNEIKGMEEGERKTFKVQPSEAYGSASDKLFFEIDKTETVPVFETMNMTEFNNRYDDEPTGRITVKDQFWGWNKKVISIEGDMIVLKNEPEVGKEYQSYKQDGPGFTSEVVSIDTNANEGKGIIEIKNHAETAITVDAEHIGEHIPRFKNVSKIKNDVGQNPKPTGIVVEVEDKIMIDFNEEVMGKTLRFNVEIVSIEKTG
ncbi:MAG: FKBP-type peptidyl-prolyl cis-trans isomerase [Thermoplasmata archaeon]